jgi:hypothetical protein
MRDLQDNTIFHWTELEPFKWSYWVMNKVALYSTRYRYIGIFWKPFWIMDRVTMQHEQTQKSQDFQKIAFEFQASLLPVPPVLWVRNFSLRIRIRLTKIFRIRFRIRSFSLRNMILKDQKWHFKHTGTFHRIPTVPVLKFSILKWSKLWNYSFSW